MGNFRRGLTKTRLKNVVLGTTHPPRNSPPHKSMRVFNNVQQQLLSDFSYKGCYSLIICLVAMIISSSDRSTFSGNYSE